jgi:mannose-1-phosphate guanylyltransferase
MLHAVIMAGGSGTRFWPASRTLRPKQLLALAGERTMLQSTLDRLAGWVPAEQQWVLTNEVLVDAIAEQIPELRGHVIGEPCKRDTAPCIGLAASLIHRIDPDATMLVMPSDHVIESAAEFQSAIEAGQQLIDEDPQRIVTFGIKPNYPAESFGYVQRGDEIPAAGVSAYRVDTFREKPDRVTAEGYVRAGTFYWNSGIFMWRADTILNALEKNEPGMAGHIRTIADSVDTDSYQSTLQREFSAIEGKSIDYAVMERYHTVVVIEAPFRWDDVGSWQALSRLHEADDQGNTVIGSHVGIDTKGCIVRGESAHTIVTIDVDDLIIVHTPDATLVAPRAAEERVREAVRALGERGLSDKL